jgi:hypothetical protein
MCLNIWTNFHLPLILQRSTLLLYSAPSPDQFNWQLEATGEKGFLAVFLHAKPPTDYKRKYRIVID